MPVVSTRIHLEGNKLSKKKSNYPLLVIQNVAPTSFREITKEFVNLETKTGNNPEEISVRQSDAVLCNI